MNEKLNTLLEMIDELVQVDIPDTIDAKGDIDAIKDRVVKASMGLNSAMMTLLTVA